MTNPHVELDAALEQVFAAAREHLTAVKAADGRIDDDAVWQAYVALNNITHEYDELLLDTFGEVTPWDVDQIDADALDADSAGDDGAHDPHTHVISVRQRRDYRVPSVSALIAAADAARGEGDDDEAAQEPIGSVGEAVLELLQSGDGSLAALDVPTLEPLDGVVAVAEVSTALSLDDYAEDDGAGPFQVGAQDRVVGRLDEHPYLDLGGELEEESR